MITTNINDSDLYKSALDEFIGEDSGEQTRVVYSYYGLAMYIAQCIEHTYENMLIINKIQDKSQNKEKNIDSIFKEARGTMGKQFNNVIKAYSISGKHEKELKEVLEKRNHLAHDFFKVNSFKFLNEDGKLEMLQECIAFIDAGSKLDKELEIYFKNLLDKIGITDEILSQAYKKASEEEENRIKEKYVG